MAKLRVAVDVGGTFTDCLLVNEETNEIRWTKVPSTPDSPDRAVVEGFKRLDIDGAAVEFFGHGTTVAINTLVQRVGARTGLITTKGFRDILEIQRFNRPDIYNLFYRKPEPLVPRNLRLEVTERMLADGTVYVPLDLEEVRAAAEELVRKGVTAIAVSFLHAYINPAHEEAAAAVIREHFPGIHVCASSEVAREWREYERTSTAVINAYLAPSVKDYLRRLDTAMAEENSFEGNVLVTRSDGGLAMARTAGERAVDLLLSGPASGVLGACDYGRITGMRNLITMDVGGTTCDVSLIRDGQPTRVRDKDVERYPVLAPFIEIHAIGAGGGTIVWVDASGMLRVGPQSAGASPGPASYGRGGENPTITDAYLILGMLDPDAFLGGKMPLRKDLAEAAFRKVAERVGMSVEECALGAVTILDYNMVDAIRVVSVEKGHDPRDFALMAYGGAGPLQVGSLASKLNIPKCLVPMYPSHLSAWGILAADLRHSFARTVNRYEDQIDFDDFNAKVEEMVAEGKAELERDGVPEDRMVFKVSVDMRYFGQEHGVNIESPSVLDEAEFRHLIERFHQAHEAMYTYAMRDQKCGILTVRVDAIGLTPKPTLAKVAYDPDPEKAFKGVRKVLFNLADGPVDCRIYDRMRLGAGARVEGPAIIEESTSTTLVHPGHFVEVDEYGNLVMTTV